MREPDAESVMGSTPEKGRTVMHYVLDHVAKRGTGGDDTLAHVTSSGEGRAGDLVIPSEKRTGKFESELSALLKTHGVDAGRFTVGDKGNKKHPETGLPVFDAGTGGDGGDGSPGTGAGDSPGMGAPGAAPGVGTGLGQSPATADAGIGPGSASPNSDPTGAGGTTTAQDVFARIANPFGLTEPSRTIAGFGIGAIPVAGQFLGPPMSAANMALHGTDNPTNPGGNLPASSTFGIGTGVGAPTDPGISATTPGNDPVLDLLMRRLNGFDVPAGPR